MGIGPGTNFVEATFAVGLGVVIGTLLAVDGVGVVEDDAVGVTFESRVSVTRNGFRLSSFFNWTCNSLDSFEFV